MSDRKRVHGEGDAQHSGDVVTLNVGGKLFTTTEATLRAVPGTYFDGFLSRNFAHARDSDGNVFIDRDGDVFTYVLHYLRNPHEPVVLPDAVDVQRRVAADLEFYNISRSVLDVQPERRSRLLVFGGYNSLQRDSATVLQLQTSRAPDVLPVVPRIGQWRVRGTFAPARAPALALLGWQESARATGRKRDVDAAALAFEPLHADACGVSTAASEPAVAGRTGDEHESWRTYACWRTLPEMPAPRCYAGVALSADGTRAYVVGGLADETHPQNTTLIYDVERQTWSNGPRMAQARCNLNAAQVAGKIYAFGGWNGTAVCNTVEMLDTTDPVTARWDLAAQVPVARYSMATAALDGRIYAIGGCDGKDLVNATDVFDVASASWSAAASPDNKRTRACAVADPERGVVYLCGGRNERRAPYDSCERFDPRVGTWSAIAKLGTKRCAAGGVMHAGVLTVVGGFNGERQIAGSERYDAVADAWVPYESMPCALDGVSVVSVDFERLRA